MTSNFHETPEFIDRVKEVLEDAEIPDQFETLVRAEAVRAEGLHSETNDELDYQGWLSVLLEELGSVAKALNCREVAVRCRDWSTADSWDTHLREELIHVGNVTKLMWEFGMGRRPEPLDGDE